MLGLGSDAIQPVLIDGGFKFPLGDARVLSPLNLTGNGVNDAREKHLSFAATRLASRLSHYLCELGRGWQAF